MYDLQANPVEQENRKLKPRYANLVLNGNSSWADNSVQSDFPITQPNAIRHAALIQFEREPRGIDGIRHESGLS